MVSLTRDNNRVHELKKVGPLGREHIVDRLIEERAPRIAAGPFWPIIGPIFRSLLGYSKARKMADAIAPLSGYAALNHVSNLLRLNIQASGTDNIPQNGRCIIVANHPTGIADGVAMFDMLKSIRPDVCVFANADAIRVCAGLSDVLIPVAWPPEKRTLQSSKATLRGARKALEADRPVVSFAAGALSRRIDGVMRDFDWEHSAVALARKFAAPVVPVHVAGPFPYLFHLFDRFSRELRDITLFHELLNKTGGDYALTVGAPIDTLAVNEGNQELTARLQAYVEQTLPSSPEAVFV